MSPHDTITRVYDFAEGSRDMRDLLGGKGANLAEMTRLGLPVPGGFTVTTAACMEYLRGGHTPPAGLDDESPRTCGARGARRPRPRRPHDRCRCRVRSGSKFTMWA